MQEGNLEDWVEYIKWFVLNLQQTLSSSNALLNLLSLIAASTHGNPCALHCESVCVYLHHQRCLSHLSVHFLRLSASLSLFVWLPTSPSHNIYKAKAFFVTGRYSTIKACARYGNSECALHFLEHANAPLPLGLQNQFPLHYNIL